MQWRLPAADAAVAGRFHASSGPLVDGWPRRWSRQKPRVRLCGLGAGPGWSGRIGLGRILNCPDAGPTSRALGCSEGSDDETTRDASEKKAGVAIKIVSGNVGKTASSETAYSTVSRLQFKIPLRLPRPTK